jgi:dephospho-CoA kinase
MLRIGLTGGIASGKSTVSRLFSALGVAIIDTDVIARDVVETGKPAIEEIRGRFGNSVIDESGSLDRSAMRKLVFLDGEARSALEAILHPKIGAEVRRQSQSVEGPYQIIAVPLLVGSPLLQFVDRVLVVDCPESTQLERLLKRDRGTIDEAKRILKAQSSREERLAIADDVVLNDADLASLHKQVTALHETYQRLATP